jgi:hypothetical protein
MVKQMPAAEAAQYVRTRRDLWQAMHRSGWYLPPLGAAVTLSYMQGVRAGLIWCPKYEQVRLRCCLVPPSTKQLVTWVEEALRLQQANHPQRPVKHGFDGRKLPDQQWALHALSTLQPDHRIFGKGYVREPRSLEELPRPAEPLVDNADGLFDGLPRLQGKLAKRTIIRKVQPSTEARLQRLRARRAQLDARMEQLAQGGAGGQPRPQNQDDAMDDEDSDAEIQSVGGDEASENAQIGGLLFQRQGAQEPRKEQANPILQREYDEEQQRILQQAAWLEQQQTELARQQEANVPFQPGASYIPTGA